MSDDEAVCCLAGDRGICAQWTTPRAAALRRHSVPRQHWRWEARRNKGVARETRAISRSLVGRLHVLHGEVDALELRVMLDGRAAVLAPQTRALVAAEWQFDRGHV